MQHVPGDRTAAATTPRQQAVLDALASTDEPLRVNEVAARMRVHPNTVRFHLVRLEQAGLVDRMAAAGGERGRPAPRYRPATAGGAPAGREASARHLVALLDDLGFEPEHRAAPDRIEMHRCPFLEGAVDRQERAEAAERPAGVSPETCAAHLGLMNGALAARGERLSVTRLEPFAKPAACVAHLSA